MIVASENESGVREGVFRCGTESVRCSLLDLPHNVETFITSDNVNFYKVSARTPAAHARF